MDARTLKFISIPIILVVNFVIGIFPYFLISKKLKQVNRRTASDSPAIGDAAAYTMSPKMKRILTLANFFCGGVFFATSLIGLYPNVHNKFQDILKKRPSIPDYPYAGLSLAAGFFLVWILEIIVHACLHSHSHSHDFSSRSSLEHNNEHHRNSKFVKVTFSSPSPNSPLFPEDQLLHQPQPSDRLLDAVGDSAEDGKLHQSESVQITVDRNTHEAHSHVPIKGNLLGSLMLTFALGSHSIIEGLGFAMIGELSMTVNMLITVLIHESVCALSLGVNLASKRTPICTSLSLLATFSALIPVGIAIGMAVHLVMEKNLVGDAVTAVLQGIAAGTFIYVVFMEILPTDVMEHQDAMLKIVMMIVGFAVIASMKAFHSHGGHKATNLNSTTGTTGLSYLTTKWPL